MGESKKDKSGQSYAGAKGTVTKKKALLQLLAKYLGNIRKSCSELGICRQTFYTWLEKDPVFKADYEELHEDSGDRYEAALDDIAFCPDERTSDRIKAIEIRLKARYKDRGYGVEKREQDHKGEVNLNHQAKVTVYLPDNDRS